MRTELATLGAAIALFADGCACGEVCDPDSCDLHGLFVAIADADGGSLPRFQIFVATDGRGARWADCGDAERGWEVACRPDGAFLADHPEEVQIVVKAPGWRHVRRSLRPTYEEEPTACAACGPMLRRGRVKIALDRLAPFEVTEDYRSGFDANDGLDAFREMAFTEPGELGLSRVVKFYIEELDAEPRVFFQNTQRWRTHHAFVQLALGRPWSLDEYEARAYHGADRTEMAGSVILYDDLQVPSEALGCPATTPLTLEFFPNDDATPTQVLQAYLLLQDRLGFSPLDGTALRFFYAPAGSAQEGDLTEARSSFLQSGALWLLNQELYGDVTMQLLNTGVAYGTLRVMPPEVLARTVVSFKDVLLLPLLPNQIPLVGGTITEQLQTPLAHVNVAARSRGTPNMALREAAADPRIAPHVDELVRFEVTAGSFSLEGTTLEEAEAFWSTRGQAETLVPPFDVERVGLLDLATTGFNDSIAVGVKAANVGELSQLLPDQSPHGFAVPFHYYEQFTHTPAVTATSCAAASADCVEEGRLAELCRRAQRLCTPRRGAESFAELAERIRTSREAQIDSGLREASLDNLRWLMRNTPVAPAFGDLIDARVAAEFGGDRIRLRSSTNAEDLPRFSGAGLYSSTGADTAGEEVASSRIRRVWASVFNWRAFEERAYWNIDHRAVRMGVLVHQAFPDEKANGVLITQNIADPAIRGMYVNVQQGEESVTNPEDGALPEIFSIVAAPDGIQVARQRTSSLSPDTPLLTDEEIAALFTAASRIQFHFAPLYGEDIFSYPLEVEFKLHGSERRLFIKQVRPYYQRSAH